MQTRINAVERKHIERLDALELTLLLKKLIEVEFRRHNLKGDSFVPLKINVADGGEDGQVKWVGDPPKTDYLPNQYTVFQNKATKLDIPACYKEIMQANKKELKPMIKEVVDANGCYILFINQEINSVNKKARVDKFRKAIKDAGHNNHESFQIEIYDSERIQEWVNQDIGAITLVQALNDIHRPEGFKLWSEWEKIMEIDNVPYIETEDIIQYKEKIHHSLSINEPIRIIGHSGLGKTRLVLECFRDEGDNPSIKALQNELVYCNLQEDITLIDLTRYITSHQNQEGILVVDECDENQHKALAGQVKALTKFRLVTINIGSRTEERAHIKMVREQQKDIVEAIIQEQLGDSHQPSEIKLLAKVCEGYPWMAVRFCKEIRERGGFEDFSSLLPEQIINRLIFGNSDTDREELQVIKAVSAFTAFGFIDSDNLNVLTDDEIKTLQEHLQFIKENVYQGNLSIEGMNAVIIKYTKKDIIQRRGNHRVVKPTILAVSLTAQWLEEILPDKLEEIIKKLEGNPLSQRFVERLKELDELDKAKALVEKLWGQTGPFGKAEVLKTSWGSLLFRHVIEVNPIATCDALFNCIESSTIDDLKELTDCRRNWVWALEKLVFRNETFYQSALMLLKLAIAENETWANNASGQFLHLFQIVLPGTEANLNDRWAIIEYALNKEEEGYKVLAIDAMGRAIQGHHFSRSGDADKQGSKTKLIDYRPNGTEITEYWSKAVKLLTNEAISGSSYAKDAKKHLVDNYRTHLGNGLVDLTLESVEIISANQKDVWIEAINAFRLALKYETITEEDRAKINSCIERITPSDLENQILLKVSKPEWIDFTSDVRRDIAKENAEKFAEELVENGTDIEAYLTNILTGEQRQAFAFGRKLGAIYKGDQLAFINEVMQAFIGVDDQLRNVEFIGGFVVGSDQPSIKKFVLEFIYENPELHRFAFYITNVHQPTIEEIESLFELVGEDKLSLANFRIFQYGRALESFSLDEMQSLITKLNDQGLNGRWLALSILFMNSWNTEDKWELYKGLITQIITEENMIVVADNKETMETFHWSEAAEKLILESKEDSLAKILAQQILEYVSMRENNFSFQSYLSKLLGLMFEKHFESVWEIISQGIIGDYFAFFTLKQIIGGRNGSTEYEGKLFEHEERFPKILKWVSKHQPEAAIRIANMCPIVDPKSTIVTQWHPFTKTLIDEYGGDEKVLDNLRANMGTYGSVGSSVGYLKRQLSLVEQLLNHQNIVVKTWAKKMFDYTEKLIKREQIENEEDYLM